MFDLHKAADLNGSPLSGATVAVTPVGNQSFAVPRLSWLFRIKSSCFHFLWLLSHC